MDSAAKQWAKFREENPKTDKAVIKIGETLEDVQQRLSEIGDNVSGAKVLEQANALISQQKKYNDVLATRLAEALDEIRTLRARVDVLEARK
jgi:UDP-N-acetylmuramoylalanine-D-glutamate ligase